MDAPGHSKSGPIASPRLPVARRRSQTEDDHTRIVLSGDPDSVTVVPRFVEEGSQCPSLLAPQHRKVHHQDVAEVAGRYTDKHIHAIQTRILPCTVDQQCQPDTAWSPMLLAELAVEVTEAHSSSVDEGAPNSIDCCGPPSLLITPREDTRRE